MDPNDNKVKNALAILLAMAGNLLVIVMGLLSLAASIAALLVVVAIVWLVVQCI